jgi:serine phosphatase RsbU (regulator of sigma subunit)
MFAEVAFTMYGSPFALTNFLGHMYKTVSYYLILGALFVSSIRWPYQELSNAKEQLQVLYADAQDHRREIEQSFARIGSALSSSIRLDEALGQIADLAIGMLHAECSVVSSLPQGYSGHQISAQRGDTHAAGRAIEVAINVGKDAIKQQASSIINNNLQASGWIECDYKQHDCLRSMVCAPMFFDGDALGVIAIYSHEFNAFEEGDRKLLDAFASHAAVAIHNAMIYERESRIADVLQRTFLSPGQLVSEGFEIAHVYASAMAEAQVGGDFYDIIDLGSGKMGLVLGDVSGKGLAAAVHTAMAKYSLRAYLQEGHSPASALALLNRTITESTSIETFITLFCAVLDTGTHELIYASAGHEPAIYAADDSYATLDSTGPAVGLGIELGYEDKQLVMQSGSVLMLYTDGVSEARRGRTFLGTEGIGEHVKAHRRNTSEDLAKGLYEAAVEFAGGDMRDDIAILAVRATF